MVPGFLATRVLPGAIEHSILRTSVKPWYISLSHSQDPEVFLSFFLGFRRHNLITGLSGWRAPD